VSEGEEPFRRLPEFPPPRQAREKTLRDPRFPQVRSGQRARHRGDGTRVPPVADRGQDRLLEIPRRTEETARAKGIPSCAAVPFPRVSCISWTGARRRSSAGSSAPSFLPTVVADFPIRGLVPRSGSIPATTGESDREKEITSREDARE